MTVPFRDCYIAISTDGVNWVDLSESGSVEIVAGAGQRPTTELYAYGADAPIVVPGRRRPMRLGITYGCADAARDDTIRTAYEAGSAFYLRYAPRGYATGNYLYSSDAGIVTSPPLPEGQRHSGAAALTRFTFETPRLTKSTIGIT